MKIHIDFWIVILFIFSTAGFDRLQLQQIKHCLKLWDELWPCSVRLVARPFVPHKVELFMCEHWFSEVGYRLWILCGSKSPQWLSRERNSLEKKKKIDVDFFFFFSSWSVSFINYLAIDPWVSGIHGGPPSSHSSHLVSADKPQWKCLKHIFSSRVSPAWHIASIQRCFYDECVDPWWTALCSKMFQHLGFVFDVCFS